MRGSDRPGHYFQPVKGTRYVSLYTITQKSNGSCLFARVRCTGGVICYTGSCYDFDLMFSDLPILLKTKGLTRACWQMTPPVHSPMGRKVLSDALWDDVRRISSPYGGDHPFFQDRPQYVLLMTACRFLGSPRHRRYRDPEWIPKVLRYISRRFDLDVGQKDFDYLEVQLLEWTPKWSDGPMTPKVRRRRAQQKQSRSVWSRHSKAIERDRRIEELTESGKSKREVSEAVGVSRSTVKRTLRRSYQYQPRPRTRTQGRRNRFIMWKVETLEQSYRSVGRQFGISPARVVQIVKQTGKKHSGWCPSHSEFRTFLRGKWGRKEDDVLPLGVGIDLDGW